MKNLDYLKVLKQRHEALEQEYTDLAEESYKEMAKANMLHYQLLLRNRRKDPSGIYRTEINLYMKKIFPFVQRAVQEDKELRMNVTLFHLHPYLYILLLAVKKGLRMIGLIRKPKGLERIRINQHKGEVSV